jgi:hypothetical protein
MMLWNISGAEATPWVGVSMILPKGKIVVQKPLRLLIQRDVVVTHAEVNCRSIFKPFSLRRSDLR